MFEMKCYCYETEFDFVFCVENAESEIYTKLQIDPFWQEGNGKFVKIYPLESGYDDTWYKNYEDKEIIKSNFAREGNNGYHTKTI